VELHDVTERLREEDALRQSEARFRTLAEHLPDVTARIDRDLRHVYVNPATVETTGIPFDTYVGRTNRGLGFPDEICDVWNAAMRDVFATGETRVLEFDVPLPGGVGTFTTHLIPERDANGAVPTLLAVTRDVTH
jgi:PAS domain S-box-containing protein